VARGDGGEAGASAACGLPCDAVCEIRVQWPGLPTEATPAVSDVGRLV
jgi:hypothetical protein